MHQCINFILFWNDTLHVSDGLSVHHQEFKTVHIATGICQTDAAVCLLAGTRWNLQFHPTTPPSLTVCEHDQYGTPSWSCSQAVWKPVWHIPLLCVQWKTPDDWQSDCPKHVEFYFKNKFEKLVHLLGFITRTHTHIQHPSLRKLQRQGHYMFRGSSVPDFKLICTFISETIHACR